jgi:hypothetical protein
MIQIALIICMGALQVFVVRFFFQVGHPFLSLYSSVLPVCLLSRLAMGVVLMGLF